MDKQPANSAPSTEAAFPQSACSAPKSGDVAEISLTRSSTGRIHLEIRTHAFGMLKIEIGSDAYTRLLFGESGVAGVVARHVPARQPVDQTPRPTPSPLSLTHMPPSPPPKNARISIEVTAKEESE